MTATTADVNMNEIVSRLLRQNTESQNYEQARVATTGDPPAAWVIKVLSLDSYNIYNVQQVGLSLPGFTPPPVGNSSTQAINIAEPFETTGNLASGTYAIMWRVGTKNVFAVAP